MRLKVTFALLNFCNTHNCFNSVCLHINWKAHAACDINIPGIVKGEGLLKITGSDVHWRSDITSETVLDRDVVTS